MEPKDYIVDRIEGDYATLKNIADGTEIFIAMALLPFGIDIGTKLHYENLEYEIVDQKRGCSKIVQNAQNEPEGVRGYVEW